MLNRNLQLSLIALLFCISSLWAQQTKMFVSVDRASVYAEPSENSTKIDNVKRGTVLTVFERGIEGTEWIYVTYQSERWKGKVTGFIKTELVATKEEMLKEDQRRIEEEARIEEVVTKPVEETEATPEAEIRPQEELPDLKEAFALKEAEETKEKEIKPEEQLEEQVKQKIEITPLEEEKITEKKEEVKPEIVPEEQIEPETELLPTEAEIPDKEEKEEILEELPQAQEVAPPPIKVGKEEEFKRDEVFPKLEIKTTIKPVDVDAPESRTISEPVSEETEEPRAFAVIQREFPPPPPRDVKAQTEIPEEKPLEEELFKIKVEEPEPEKEVVESPKDETPPPPPAKVEEEKVEEVKEEVKPEETGEEPEPEEEPQEVNPPEQMVPPKDIIGQAAPFPKQSLFTMGFGYGPSLGGLGTFVQFNTKSGFSLHVGAGYYPATAYYSQYDWLKNEMLYSAGIKYYLPFGNHKLHPYIDLQYGGISVEAVQVVSEIWYGDYVYENIQKTLYGPSILGGVELRAGVLGINAALGLTYNTTEWGYWDQDLFFNGDFGVVIYF